VHFARASGPQIVFQPSDADASARASIDAWTAASGVPNVRPALALDATTQPWPIAGADVVLYCNMIHIAPWEAAVGLVNGAARVLPPGGILFLYGPFKREGRHTAPSNEAFDRDFLRARNPAWGVRDLEAVAALAELASRRPWSSPCRPTTFRSSSGAGPEPLSNGKTSPRLSPRAYPPPNPARWDAGSLSANAGQGPCPTRADVAPFATLSRGSSLIEPGQVCEAVRL